MHKIFLIHIAIAARRNLAIFLSLAFAMIQLTFRRNALIELEPCHSPLQELCTAIIDWILISYNVLNFVCSTEWP